MKKAFRLPQRQAKKQPKCECRLDGEIGIDWLPVALTVLRRCPGIDGILTDPQGEITAIV